MTATMKIQSQIIATLLIAVFLLVGRSMASGPAAVTYETMDIPVFPGAYDVRKEVDSGDQTRTVTYQVQTTHPAAEILQFYDVYFNGRGWRSGFETCQRNWGGSESSASPDDAAPSLLFASGEHFDLNMTVDVWLKTETTGQAPITVTCRLQQK
jgi:hypothetical protein